MTLASSRMTSELDVSDAAQVAEFERAFYRGFRPASHNRLVRWLWEWDHDNQIVRTRIPYADQRIWGRRDEAGSLTTAVAVNVAMRSLQASAYGFQLPPELSAKPAALCEFLTFFAVGEHSLHAKLAFWRELFAELRTADFQWAVATTSPKVLPMYRWMGAEQIGETNIEGETRIFLLFDLRRIRRDV